jgi:EAL domain-containing protein (putative c-di-GMP-specific phosphodiesterase class I)
VCARLAAMGCDQGQGFSISRALPAPQFTAWLTAQERDAMPLSA